MVGLRRRSSLTLVPNCVAIENSVSPGLTVHLTCWPSLPVVSVVVVSVVVAVVDGVVDAVVVEAVVVVVFVVVAAGGGGGGSGGGSGGGGLGRRRRVGHRERLDRAHRGRRRRCGAVGRVPDHARARQDQDDHGDGSEQRGRCEVGPRRAATAGLLLALASASCAGGQGCSRALRDCPGGLAQPRGLGGGRGLPAAIGARGVEDRARGADEAACRPGREGGAERLHVAALRADAR